MSDSYTKDGKLDSKKSTSRRPENVPVFAANIKEHLRAISQYLREEGYGPELDPTLTRPVIDVKPPAVQVPHPVKPDINDIKYAIPAVVDASGNATAATVNQTMFDQDDRKFKEDYRLWVDATNLHDKANTAYYHSIERNSKFGVKHDKAIGELKGFFEKHKFDLVERHPKFIADPTLYTAIEVVIEVYRDGQETGVATAQWMSYALGLEIPKGQRHLLSPWIKVLDKFRHIYDHGDHMGGCFEEIEKRIITDAEQALLANQATANTILDIKQKIQGLAKSASSVLIRELFLSFLLRTLPETSTALGSRLGMIKNNIETGGSKTYPTFDSIMSAMQQALNIAELNSEGLEIGKGKGKEPEKGLMVMIVGEFNLRRSYSLTALLIE